MWALLKLQPIIQESYCRKETARLESWSREVLKLVLRCVGLGLLVVLWILVVKLVLVIKWTQIFVGRGRHYQSLLCVNCWIIEWRQVRPILISRPDHHFHGCASLYYTGVMIFSINQLWSCVLGPRTWSRSWSWVWTSWSWQKCACTELDGK